MGYEDEDIMFLWDEGYAPDEISEKLFIPIDIVIDTIDYYTCDVF